VRPGRIYAGQAGATKWPSGKVGKATLGSRIGGNHLRGSISASTFRSTLASALADPLKLVAIDRVRLHADLTILAKLSCALARARAMPLAA
jgi:hypothetical protein